MVKELKNNTTNDDMLGAFKAFFIILIVISVISCLVLYLLMF